MQRDKCKAILDVSCGMMDDQIDQRIAPQRKKSNGFALYEVLLGVTVFVIGVLALGRAVQNCLNASALSAEDGRVRQILSNRMAEIQATPGNPDSAKESKVETGYGMVKLIQKTTPAQLTEQDGVELTGIQLVTLTVQWSRGGVAQSKNIEFYVYRGS
jgi:Tfp pilus assembly protein PilV